MRRRNYNWIIYKKGRKFCMIPYPILQKKGI